MSQGSQQFALNLAKQLQCVSFSRSNVPLLCVGDMALRAKHHRREALEQEWQGVQERVQ